jgi:hypothetical protein
LSAADSRTGTSPPKFSLFSRTSSKTYGATNFIWRLLELVERDIIRFKRNNHVSHAIVTNAKALYDAINVLIEKVDSDDSNDWSNYDAYNAAIDALEEWVIFSVLFIIILFNFIG